MYIIITILHLQFGWTPVMYAIKSGHLEIVKLLGVDLKAMTKQVSCYINLTLMAYN